LAKLQNILKEVYLLLGGNVGDVRKTLCLAYDLINEKIGTIDKKSSLYSTEPWGEKNQAPFLNQCILVKTTYSAQNILQLCLEIEIALGRKRLEKWSARTIDIDILFIDNEIIDESNLKVPHPYIQKRNFALIPMHEISKEFVHPILLKTIEELKLICSDKCDVLKIEE